MNIVQVRHNPRYETKLYFCTYQKLVGKSQIDQEQRDIARLNIDKAISLYSHKESEIISASRSQKDQMKI